MKRVWLSAQKSKTTRNNDNDYQHHPTAYHTIFNITTTFKTQIKENCSKGFLIKLSIVQLHYKLLSSKIIGLSKKMINKKKNQLMLSLLISFNKI